jgi:hypothetical protein
MVLIAQTRQVLVLAFETAPCQESRKTAATQETLGELPPDSEALLRINYLN